MTTTNNNKLVFISSILVICFAALIVVQMANAALQESLSTRTTKAEGVLNCNGVPIQKAYVRLFKGNSDGFLSPKIKIKK